MPLERRVAGQGRHLARQHGDRRGMVLDPVGLGLRADPLRIQCSQIALVPARGLSQFRCHGTPPDLHRLRIPGRAETGRPKGHEDVHVAHEAAGVVEAAAGLEVQAVAAQRLGQQEGLPGREHLPGRPEQRRVTQGLGRSRETSDSEPGLERVDRVRRIAAAILEGVVASCGTTFVDDRRRPAKRLALRRLDQIALQFGDDEAQPRHRPRVAPSGQLGRGEAVPAEIVRRSVLRHALAREHRVDRRAHALLRRARQVGEGGGYRLRERGLRGEPRTGEHERVRHGAPAPRATRSVRPDLARRAVRLRAGRGRIRCDLVHGGAPGRYVQGLTFR
ncbi:MAG: hypothetical protein IPG91_03175 [Ideonella sp.]|nr:hypothetical protein [Ideonella sp.]